MCVPAPSRRIFQIRTTGASGASRRRRYRRCSRHEAMNCIARLPILAGVTALRLAVFLGTVGVAYGAQDVVITTTGDRLVGEIKSVEKDVLTMETAYSDADFRIEWEHIASIESDRQFLVETFDGRRLSGSLRPDPDKKPVVQIAGTSVPLQEVSAVQPFERSFWARFDTALDFGYSMTR